MLWANKRDWVMRRILAVLVLLWPGIGVAQDDPMALQRCVWACLADSPGAASLQYNQCVDTRCVAQPQLQTTPSLPTFRSDWRGGLASNGVHHYAGTQAEQGYAFNYFCTPTESFFVLGDLPIEAGQYRLLIGSVEYLVPFDRKRGALSVDIPPGSAFMQAVQRGQMLTVQDMNRRHVIRFSLAGAQNALSTAVGQCF